MDRTRASSGCVGGDLIGCVNLGLLNTKPQAENGTLSDDQVSDLHDVKQQVV